MGGECISFTELAGRQRRMLGCAGSLRRKVAVDLDVPDYGRDIVFPLWCRNEIRANRKKVEFGKTVTAKM
jgi:hypothetical protein